MSSSDVLACSRPSSFLGCKWLDASFTGNGKIGGAVLGAYSDESILINHTNLKHKGYTGVLQDVSDKFPNIRKLYNDAKLFDAEKLLSTEFARRGYKPMPEQPLPLCTIDINFVHEGFITDYARTTDMLSGEVCVEYKSGATSISRGLFISRGTDVVAYNVAKSGSERLNFSLRLASVEGQGTQAVTTKYENGYMYFACRAGAGLDFGMVARVIMNTGVAEHRADGIYITGNEGFTVFAKTFINSSREQEFKKLKNELSEIRASYDRLLLSHANAHKKLYMETTLELGGASQNYDVASLIASASHAKLESSLLTRLFNFGKYLVICGGDVLTPQGLWCGDINATNGFLQFNNTAHLLYSGVTSSVSPNSIFKLFSEYEKFADDLKKNSARTFGTSGYFVPNIVSPSSALIGRTAPDTVHFIASCAIAANVFYNYFSVTGDIKILKSKILPFMREVFNFYSDFLKIDDSGYYSTIPSYSPSSTPGNVIGGKRLSNFAFSVNSTIDFLAIQNLLSNLIEGSSLVGAYANEVPVWQDMQTKIPPFQVADNGAIREYTNSAFIDSPYNMGTMHAYGLWPLKNFACSDAEVSYKSAVDRSGQIVNSTIPLKRASANAVLVRLIRANAYQNAQTIATCALQLAHADDAVNTRNVLLRFIASCFTSSGVCLTNDWRGSGFSVNQRPALDIAGNIGLASAISACVVSSDAHTLKILPSAFEELGAGSIKGVATDFGARVSLDWDLRKSRVSLKIYPRRDCTINIVLPKNLRLKKRIDNEDPYLVRDVALANGKVFTLDI